MKRLALAESPLAAADGAVAEGATERADAGASKAGKEAQLLVSLGGTASKGEALAGAEAGGFEVGCVVAAAAA